MTIDWNAFSSLLGLVAAIIAIVALVLETRRSRVALLTDAQLRLNDKMESHEIKELRKKAARNLLSGESPNYELSDVLDFFGSIAFLLEAGAIDADLAYKEFSWWIIRYWLCAQDYIKEQRKIDPQSWITLERVAKSLLERERKEGYPPETYSSEILHVFLCEEARHLDKKK